VFKPNSLKKALAIIPARTGSKRVPMKNFRMLNGLQLIEYSILAAVVSYLISRIVVTTDAERSAIISRANFDYVKRPTELCADDADDLSVIRHVIDQGDYDDFDLIAYLRPTTPFRATYHIDEAIKAISLDTAATGLRSVEEMPESAYKCYINKIGYLWPIRKNGDDFTDKPNQFCEKTYKANGYVDICRKNVVMSGKLWGDRILAYETPRTIEIDTTGDWQYAEYHSRRTNPMNVWKD
jgi:CMP-N-acetylneuraminic acid synthetase